MDEDHAAHAAKLLEPGLEEGSLAWAEWVKDYYRDVETYDWVDVADHLRGPEALFPAIEPTLFVVLFADTARLPIWTPGVGRV